MICRGGLIFLKDHCNPNNQHSLPEYPMVIQFHIHYKIQPEQQIAVKYRGGEEKFQNLQMQSYDGENWLLSLDVEGINGLEYKYLLVIRNQEYIEEWGNYRKITLSPDRNRYYYINDFWRNRDAQQNAFLSTAFTKAIFSRKKSKGSISKKSTVKRHHLLQINMMAALPEPYQLGIIGNTEALGKWLKPIPMDETQYPKWTLEIPLDSYDISFQYKYVLLHKESGEIQEWEIGDNRNFKRFLPETETFCCVIHDQDFRSGKPWKGAGVAIPIFSLRTKTGFGIGEFSDLLPLVRYSGDVGLKVIQVLPVNDTLANKTWQDSYPYAAISVFALHPLYVNVEKIAAFQDKKAAQSYEQERKSLNKLDQIDFEKVMDRKLFYFHILFEQEFDRIKDNASYRVFLKKNEDWLPAYAAFCAFRDRFQTCNYETWGKYSDYNPELLKALRTEDQDFSKKCDFYSFIQYHAHDQLTEARDLARQYGIALKGDLPIGIYRYSCDAWVAPRLYNMDQQAGAPPDDFAELGQNWGFPTYNWEEMALDDFSWWKGRMQKLNEYFDALRIDHILGFFRIWFIPANQVSGTMGLFNPRLPYTMDEIILSGLKGEIERFTKPFLTEEYVLHYLANNPDVIEGVLETQAEGMYRFKKEYPDQASVQMICHKNNWTKEVEAVLLKMMSEIIFIEEKQNGQSVFNPRITVHTTYSFQCLNDDQKRIVQALYDDYYFKRHDTFWKNQALWKLPALLDASDMLICGEDLGMIPHSVPDVMRSLNILSLEIQRMPKGSHRFGQVQEYPYFSVSSPSCHDMSTIRGWWEGDHEMAKEYYYQYMHGYGYTPMKCEARIVQFVVEDHLSGPSMLAVFPLQDLVGMDADLRRLEAGEEQINEPSNPKHYWRFRFHINMEDLDKSENFKEKLKQVIQKFRP